MIYFKKNFVTYPCAQAMLVITFARIDETAIKEKNRCLWILLFYVRPRLYQDLQKPGSDYR